MDTTYRTRARGRLKLLAASLALAGFVAFAEGPAAVVSHAEGSITRSPQGDREWTDLKVSSPLVRGDRVWTDKGSRILKMSTELKAGVVWANTFNKFDPTSPFGGYKESGFGREGGRQGLLDYCQLV